MPIPRAWRAALNYRHAFHAGNFADVMKHALLARILTHLGTKPAPYRYIDTHAGIGLYDLEAEEALRTGEWADGIGRMDTPFGPELEDLLSPYRAAVASVRAAHGASAYPGSPLVAASLLRPDDRASLVEKHPEDVKRLSAAMRGIPGFKVKEADGWLSLPGLVPPKERRGFVLVDPPYEEPGELARAAKRFAASLKRWNTGIFALWYPVKDPAPIAEALDAIAGASDRPCLKLELYVDRPADDPARLNGNGMLIVNPPWRLAEEAERLLPALSERLARSDYGAYRCEWLRDEQGRRP